MRRVQTALKCALLLGMIAFPITAMSGASDRAWNPPQAIAFSTYLGGEEQDWGVAISGTPDGGLVLAGTTSSLLFPTVNAFQPDFAGGFRDLAYDGFLTAYTPLDTVRFSTYFGGSDVEFVHGLAVAPDGNIWLGGGTGSSDLPVVGNVSYSGGGFVAKFSPSGSLLFSTHFCGDGRVDALAVDGQGDAWVACLTRSAGLPVVGGFQEEWAGGADGFIAELSPSGNLLYSTYVGGSGDDYIRTIAVHGDDVAFGGTTTSPYLPVRNAFQPTNAGGNPDPFVPTPFELMDDGFVGSVRAGRLQFLSYLGGSAADVVESLAYDENGVLFATGTTISKDFWQIGAPPPASDGADVFLSELNRNGSLVFSTRIGGPGDDIGYGISVDREELHVGGSTFSNELPDAVLLTPNSFVFPEPVVWTFLREDLTHSLTEVIGGSKRPSGLTYLVQGNVAGVVAMDADSLAITGTTFLLDFPLVDATQPRYGGAYYNYDDYQTFGDAFVAKIRTCGFTPCTGVNMIGEQGMSGWWISNVTAALQPACLCDVYATKYQLDGGALTNGANANIAGDGTHALEYHSVATTGSVEPTAFLQVRIDTTPPVVQILAPAYGTVTVNDDAVTLPSVDLDGTSTTPQTAIVAGNITVSLTAFDATSGVQAVTLRVDNTTLGQRTQPPYDFSWDTSTWSFGVHALTADAVDVAGNEAAVEENVTVLSTVLPPMPPASLRAGP